MKKVKHSFLVVIKQILQCYILIPAPPDHQLSPTQVLTLNQSLRRIRDGVGRISTEHKELHSSVSKVGKTIDRVRNCLIIHIFKFIIKDVPIYSLLRTNRIRSSMLVVPISVRVSIFM